MTRWLACAALLAGCAQHEPAKSPELAPDVVLGSPDGSSVSLRRIARGADLTVVTFFSAHCPTQRAHDRRLVELYAAYASRNVQFVAIDAESGASADRAASERAARGYPFAIHPDASGASADALGARYATYTVVLDRDARVRYAGGIDSDRVRLTADATPYLRDALDDLLAGREPRRARAEALGCMLTR